jgi:hypothetical protein
LKHTGASLSLGAPATPPRDASQQFVLLFVKITIRYIIDWIAHGYAINNKWGFE